MGLCAEQSLRCRRLVVQNVNRLRQSRLPNIMDVRLQIAGKKDLHLLLDYVRAYHEFEGIEDSNEVASSIRPLLERNDSGRIWLDQTESGPVGYIAVCFDYSIEFAGRDAFIDEMFIVPKQRAKGIGKAALRLLRSEAESLGVKALHLEVARTNERAQRLYASAGFQAREQFFLMSAATTNSTGHQDDAPGRRSNARSSND